MSKIIVALDVPKAAEAHRIIDALEEAKEDKSLVGVKIKVSSHQLRSFYRISGLMLPSFLVSASL